MASRHASACIARATLASLTFALLVVAPSASHAQEPLGALAVDRSAPNHERAENRPRLSAYLPVHGGGSWRLRFPASDIAAAAGPSVGLGLRVEFPLMKYLAVGLLGEFLSVSVDGRRNAIALDTDAWVKGRYVFGLTTRLDLEGYVGIPIGLSWMSFGDGGRNLASGLGLNTGFHMGATALIDGRFGVFIDFGMRHRQIWTESRTGLGGSVKTAMTQFAWNLGGTLVF